MFHFHGRLWIFFFVKRHKKASVHLSVKEGKVASTAYPVKEEEIQRNSDVTADCKYNLFNFFASTYFYPTQTLFEV